MKKLAVYFMFVMFTGIVSAQVTELKEARVGFDPLLPEIVVSGNTYRITPKEKYAGEFEQDPMAYLNNYCNIEAFIDLVQDDNTSEYVVDIKSDKGNMQAKYCGEGNLKKVTCKLKNVLLPEDIREEVYRKYKGWIIVQNVHVVKGRNGKVGAEYYKIKLENNGRFQTLRINRNKMNVIEIAGL